MKFVTLLILISYIFCKNLDSTNLSYLKSKEQDITNGKIEFTISEDNEISCIAKENIKKNEIVFKIPEDYLLSTFDMFPFKFEIKDAVFSYFSKFATNNQMQQSENKSSQFILTFYLMFLSTSNRDKILEDVSSKLKLNYYNVKIKQKAVEYLKILPPTYGLNMYDEEEKYLVKLVGLNVDKMDEMKEVFEYVIKNLKDSRFAVKLYIS
jgi:hypothetical protein